MAQGEPAGAPQQAAPSEFSPAQRTAPILPPLSQPQPTWKQELKPEAAPSASPDQSPAPESTDKKEE
jgi:hypothetical protein